MNLLNSNFHKMLIYYLPTFLLIFYTFSSLSGLVMGYANETNILYFVLIIIIFLSSKGREINNNAILIYLVLVINCILTMLANLDYVNGYFLVILALTNALLVSSLITRENFYDAYVKIMIFLSICSLVITYIIIPYFPQIFGLIRTYVNPSGVSYANFYFAIPITSISRNNGIFGEPGMYSVYLSIALTLEMFYVERKTNLIFVFILILTMLTTFSPVPIIQTILLLIAFFISNRETRSQKYRLSILLVVLGLSFALMLSFLPELQAAWNGMVRKVMYKESSFLGRTWVIERNLITGFTHVFLGNGIINGLVIGMDTEGAVTKANTSTTTIWFTLFGALFPIIMTWLQYKIANICKIRSLIAKLLIFITLVLSINSQMLLYDQLNYIIIFSYFMKSKKENVFYENCLGESDTYR